LFYFPITFAFSLRRPRGESYRRGATCNYATAAYSMAQKAFLVLYDGTGHGWRLLYEIKLVGAMLPAVFSLPLPNFPTWRYRTSKMSKNNNPAKQAFVPSKAMWQ